MSTHSLSQLKLMEYRQRRQLESLRNQLYLKVDLDQSTDITDKLDKAEKELREIQEKRKELERSSTPATDAVLLSNEPADVTKPGGILLGADSTGIETKVLLRMSRVPTGVAHLLDVKETPLVSFKVKNRKDEILRVRLTSYIEGFSAKAVDTVEIEALAPDAVTVDQLPTFFPDRLASVNELTRATLNIRIDDLDGKTEKESTFPIWLMARTSAFNSIYDPATKDWKDISHYYGAWVTPNVPEVMQILRRAADLHPDKSMAGYQVDKAGVKEQVKAIYKALQAEKIMYIHSIVNFGATDQQDMQRVRLPRESLANKSANCIDGTCLMASVLEAASINPGFVFVPGHAFLAWQTEEDADDWDYVETTMISTHSFEAACKEGRRQAKEQQAAFETSQDITDYLRYSLADLRALRGIYPME